MTKAESCSRTARVSQCWLICSAGREARKLYSKKSFFSKENNENRSLQAYADGDQACSPTTTAHNLIGTLLYLPEEVLQARAHIVSNALEELFISLISICSGGKMAGSHLMSRTSLQIWAAARAGLMRMTELPETPHIPVGLWRFVQELHALFLPASSLSPAQTRDHCTSVSPSAFKDVCQQFLSAELMMEG